MRCFGTLLLEGDSIVQYAVENTKLEEINRKLGELIELRKDIIAKKEIVPVGSVAPQEQFAVRDNIVFHGFSVKEPELGKDSIAKVTTKTIYSAPTTMAYCLKAGAGTNIGDNIDKVFFRELASNDSYLLFRNLIKNAPSREALFSLLEGMDFDVTVLEEFLRTYHPDLYHLRSILPYMRLESRNRFDVSGVKRDIELLKSLGKVNGARELEDVIRSAEENTELQKRLSLEFKGNYYDYNDELPF